MIQNKLLYTVDSKIFPKVLRRLDDSKNTCLFAIPDDKLYNLTREELKMIPLVDDLHGKELTTKKYTKNILIYHHPYYLIVPIFEFFVFKNGKVNQYLNSLTITKNVKRKNPIKDLPLFNISFKTNNGLIQTSNAVVIKLKTNGETTD